ncbi:signal peptidase I [Neobacillus niacini]|uniref:signal peptidase I n=1 Tax=Neobacillus niacini TaxID=86668 RepID=UPI0005EDC601|nr:signal peptidase I [Neobacillus niacini]
MKKRSIKWLSNIIFSIFFLLIVYIGVTVFQTSKNPGSLPSFFGFTPLTVLSNSMQPHLQSGDLIFIKKAEFEDIKVNDVITFKESDTKFITHRVIDVKEQAGQAGQAGLVTKGDNNNVEDSMIVTKDHFVGKQVAAIPKLGYVSDFASGPIGFLLLITIPLTGYICLTVFERLSRKEKQHTNEEIVSK